MDKLVNIQSVYFGDILQSEVKPAEFALEISSEPISTATNWTEVEQYVSQRVPLVESPISSDVLREAFKKPEGLYILVPEATQSFRIKIKCEDCSFPELEPRISGSIS